MKKIYLALIACATLGSSCYAMADGNHTVSLGYANSKIEEGPNLKGINAKYRYEWDSPISVITSFTYMSARDTDEESYSDMKVQTKDRYISLAAGPAYRFNEFLSIYGLAGLNFNKYTSEEKPRSHVDGSQFEYDKSYSKGVAFMYGAGIQINPIQNVSIDIGYEGSRTGSDNDHYSINGFNVGVGYRF